MGRISKKGNSENFYQVMKGFYEELVNQWIEKGNKAEYFQEKGEKVVIIFDNASFHKKEDILKKIEA